MFLKISYFIVLFLLINECTSLKNSGYCGVGKINNNVFNRKNIKLIMNNKKKKKVAYGLHDCVFISNEQLKCKLNIPYDFDDDILFEFESITSEEEKYLKYNCNCNYTDIQLQVVKKNSNGQYEYTNTIDMYDKDSFQKLSYVFGDGRSACKLNLHIKSIKGKNNSITNFSYSNLAQYSSKGACVLMGNLYTTINSYYRAKSTRYIVSGITGGLLCSGVVDYFYKISNKNKIVDKPDYQLIFSNILET
ncbi:hypothetical protein PIROE2DRAFT_8205 [Piromyces sp. E2]|nr:hypothetical protein PIROE2DRAFT_8205 [Piromyces sp. E2]|eukprot:OUM64895.1 hypothetical protein PIROE2DRAFT_8205 [Piromyces sp. E2]